MNPKFSTMNDNYIKIKSIKTLNDLINILNQVRDKVGGNVNVTLACDSMEAMSEENCSFVEDVMIYGCQSMLNKNSNEDTRVVIF